MTFGPDSSKAHVWMGITLSSLGEFEGTKVKIANSKKIKEYWDQAIVLNPKDNSPYNLVGRFCKAILELSWAERKGAELIFGTLPKVTYAEALSYFQKAEKISPGTWLNNQLCVAECMVALKRPAEAKAVLRKALKTPVRTEEDKESRTVVDKLLRQLG